MPLSPLTSPPNPSSPLLSSPLLSSFSMPPSSTPLLSMKKTPDSCPPPILPPLDEEDTPIDLQPKHGPLHNHAILALTVLACIFAVSLMSTFMLILYYRRLKRRRALAALADVPLFPTDPENPAAGGGMAPGDGGDDGDDPIHHVWYIRTVGLDEATIESIAVTQYKAGSALLGSADCSVCLGDFQDGDLVRLLPKCGHAFHVPCIDTWLRAHVNCPVCRSDVVDATVPASDGDYASATSEASAGDTEEATSEARASGEVRLEVQSGGTEENENEDEVFEDIPLSDSSSDSAVSTLQLDLEQRERRRTEPVRHRSASVDSPFMIPSVVFTVPEISTSELVLKEAINGDEQTRTGKEKERASTGSKVGSTQMGRFEMARSFSSSSGSGRSFFFSRSGRSRSTVLPL